MEASCYFIINSRRFNCKQCLRTKNEEQQERNNKKAAESEQEENHRLLRSQRIVNPLKTLE